MTRHWPLNCHVDATYEVAVAAGQSGGDTWQVQAGRRTILRLLEGAMIGWQIRGNDWLTMDPKQNDWLTFI
ncbi:hypothetical protein Tco_1375809 [Tanacetum coccineum]